MAASRTQAAPACLLRSRAIIIILPGVYSMRRGAYALRLLACKGTAQVLSGKRCGAANGTPRGSRWNVGPYAERRCRSPKSAVCYVRGEWKRDQVPGRGKRRQVKDKRPRGTEKSAGLMFPSIVRGGSRSVMICQKSFGIVATSRATSK